MIKTVPIPYITALEQLYEDFNDNLSCFVTFRVQTEDTIISNVTIPYARFRPMDDRNGLIEVRSCDCNGTICKHPTQRLYLSDSELKNYKFLDCNNLHYAFGYMVKSE